MMKLPSNRGIALLAALGLALVMAVVARGVLMMNPSLKANQAKTQTRALEAAMSGLEYAKSRLGADPTWKADTSQKVVVSTPTLTVVEDRGNVIGLLTLDNGAKARFRLRFNYQDGAGGPDGLDDPTLLLSMPELSYNNILSTGSVMLPPTGTELPGRAVALSVEGESGVGIADLTPETLNETPSSFTHRELLRTVLAAEIDLPAGDAVVMAGGGIDVTVAPTNEVLLQASDDAPRVRTKKGIALHESGGDADVRFEGSQAEVGFDENIGMSANVVGTNIPSETNEFVADGLDFYNLPWDQVKTADSDPNTSKAVQLPAGVYLLKSKDEIYYYDMTVADFMAITDESGNPSLPTSAPTTIIESADFEEVRTPENLLNNPEGIEFSAHSVSFLMPGPTGPPGSDALVMPGSEGVLTISKDLFVQPSASGNKDFAIVSKDLSTEVADPNNPMKFSESGQDQLAVALQVQNATVSCDGDMLMRAGQLQLLEATLTGPGSLDFQTMQLTGTAGHDNLSVYFKGDVAISSYDPSWQRYGELNMAGTLYSQGNIKVTAGEQGLLATRWGDFTLDGNVVSYGGNPTEANPGASGGLFSLMAKSAKLNFDPTSVAGLFDLEQGFPKCVSLQISSYNVSSR